MYFRVGGGISRFPAMLIYPVPPAPGFVGIHTTPDLGGGMRLGPYDEWVDTIEYTVDETLRDLVFQVNRIIPALSENRADQSGHSGHSS